MNEQELVKWEKNVEYFLTEFIENTESSDDKYGAAIAKLDLNKVVTLAYKYILTKEMLKAIVHE